MSDESETSPGPQDVPSESRVWAIVAHMLPVVSLPVLGALFVWMIKRDEDPFIEEHSREALNFQISVAIYLGISTILMVLIIGFLLIPIILIGAFVLAILASVKASNGEPYRYMLSIRFVKPRGEQSVS
ncbi:MAG: DUF4870 domain-containing protein [Actinomycetota bacterium]|nr:DUF4870 domain-containing protein [Actinomycetota bacterium]MDK1026911.1 DUF4870 domain-containing protein [Actinomycetota bacterium]MDK1039070.1 DUF4870 domain-containing protein [Actinomycetota bacterium]MDK1096143.1 DUF4870 domain-containing protein [Actinomycetota bacterium]MDK1103296.1 DUF4870 domain-containing protein [Actinomycetota bacterium]